MSIKLIAALTLMGLVILFVLQNVAVVEIQFLFWSFSIARSLLLFLVMGIGILLGWLLKSFAVMQKKKTRTK